jgi:hypothetical protein
MQGTSDAVIHGTGLLGGHSHAQPRGLPHVLLHAPRALPQPQLCMRQIGAAAGALEGSVFCVALMRAATSPRHPLEGASMTAPGWSIQLLAGNNTKSWSK